MNNNHHAYTGYYLGNSPCCLHDYNRCYAVYVLIQTDRSCFNNYLKAFDNMR